MNINSPDSSFSYAAQRARKNNSVIYQLFVSIFFYSSLAVMLLGSYLGAIDTNFRLFSGVSLLMTFLSGVVALIVSHDCRKIIKSKVVLLYAFFFAVYLFIGLIIFRNNLRAIIFEFGGFRGFFWGIFFFYLIIRSYKPKFQLLAFVLVPSLLVLYGQTLEIGRADIDVVGQSSRITAGLEPLNFFLLIPMGIALCVLSRYGWRWILFIWITPLLMLYSSGFLAARRYGLICVSFLVFTVLIVLTYQMSNGILSNRSFLIRYRPLRKMITIVFTILAVILLIELFLNISSIVDNFLVFDRLSQVTQGDRSIALRFKEAIEVIHSHQDLEFLFGRGIGATFFSTPQSQFTDATSWAHISAFTFWLKGGIVLFFAYIYCFYIAIPRLFLRALTKPSSMSPRKRTAILTVLPGVLAWAILSLTEGRITILYTIPFGFAYASYFHFKTYGIKI